MQQRRSEQSVVQYMPYIVFAEYKTLTKSQRAAQDVLRVNISICSQSCINAVYKRFSLGYGNYTADVINCCYGAYKQLIRTQTKKKIPIEQIKKK